MVELDPAQREARAREVRHEVVAQLTEGAHRTFRILFAAQWAIALLVAWKHAQPGDSRFAITLILGGMLCVPAFLFIHAAPLAAWVRHFVAISQIGWSMLFIWLFGGRLDAQFHVFVSLAFLAFYRDWPVLLTATLAALAYPAMRIVTLPDINLAGAAAWWRMFDQAVWVVAEFLVMLFALQQTHRTTRKFGDYAANLQLTNEAIGKDIHERTAELRRSREQYRLIAETMRAVPFELDLAQGRFSYIGPQAEKILGFPEARWKQNGFLDRAAAARTRERDAHATRGRRARQLRSPVLGGDR